MSITAQREPPRYAPEWRSSPSRQEPDVHRNRRNTQKNRQTNVLTRRPLLGAVLPISIVWCLSQSMCDSISMYLKKKTHMHTEYMGTYLHTYYQYAISIYIWQKCLHKYVMSRERGGKSYKKEWRDSVVKHQKASICILPAVFKIQPPWWRSSAQAPRPGLPCIL